MRNVYRLSAVLLLLASAVFQAVPARAAGTIAVNSLADTIASNDLCTLREAIDNANNNAATHPDCAAGSGADTIAFTLPGTVTLASTLPEITDSAGLTIDGAARAVTLSGNELVRVLDVYGSGALTLTGIRIVRGHATGEGGGVINYGTLTVINSIFDHNASTNSGGAIWNGAKPATITGTVFSFNNTGGYGGALYNSSTTPSTIASSLFSDNVSLSLGGAILNAGQATIRRTTFLRNTATTAGGAILNYATLAISNSTFTQNSSVGNAGGIASSGTATILNSTFSANSAGEAGGSLFVWPTSSGTPALTLYNTILANTPAGVDCYNSAPGTAILAGTNNIIETGTNCEALTSLSSDPKLGALTGSPGYLPLNIGSPAIDAGRDTLCAAAPVNNTSQNGTRRPQGAHCDIGSTEADVTVTFKSNGAQDGWVLENTETGNAGSLLDIGGISLRLGDNAARRQFRSLVSFSTGTALPAGAVVTRAMLYLQQSGIIGGGNPVTDFQGIKLDIRKGFFGTAPLEPADFQAAPGASYGPFLPALAGGWYSIDLTAARAQINTLPANGGLTQIRLRFKLDDNNNAIANYLSVFSGNAPAASRPKLTISYYLP